MPNPECNAVTYVPPTTPGGKGQVILRSLPNTAGQVTNFAFPWSGPPLTTNVPPADNPVPLSKDAPYQSGG
jgi:hypothetical protein